MAHVFLNGNLKLFTGGKTEFNILAKNMRGVFKELESSYPALKPHLREGIAVAIDGQIFQDAWLETIEVETEVHIIPRIGGG